VEERIAELLQGQPFAVLCTYGEGQPYGSVVAYAFSPDLKTLVFATPMDTRKYRQLCECDRVALVIDSRSTHADDLAQVEAVTATGQAMHVQPGPELDRLARLLGTRHPQLKAFFADGSNALFRVEIDQYVHVSRFQDVRRWIP
jgi:nitroimidazol reductase NimA-like FMN-containing flavoprotein (pyridoxamine 5'-phosphate oxidase superfamily)